MTKKVNETLKKDGIEKKTSLKISRKNTSKVTKKVILETPILEQVCEKKVNRTISRKKPEPKAIGSLSNVQKNNLTSQEKQENKVSTEKNIIDVSKVEIMDKLGAKASTVSNCTNTGTSKVKEIKLPKANTKKTNTTLTPNTPIQNSKKNSYILENKQILVKPKRTLKLNLGNTISPAEEEKINSILEFNDISNSEVSPKQKKDVSINQNSSFFSEPSVFKRFDIAFSHIDEENNEEDMIKNNETSDLIHDENNDENSDSDNAEQDDLVNALLDEFIEEQLVSEEAENTAENTIEENEFDFVSKEVPEEFKEAVEKSMELSAKKQKFIEAASNDYDFLSTETPDIYKPSLDLDNNDNTYEESNNSNSSVVPEISNIETENLNENLLETNFLENKEAAGNFITDKTLEIPQENASNSAVEKFFDSSIPSMAKEPESDSSYFKQIKKSLFSNIPKVFKKFSYEEASLLNSEKEAYNEDSPIIDLSQTASTVKDIKPVIENLDNNENSLNTADISVSQNTIKLPNVNENILESQDTAETVQDNFPNILTPLSSNDVSLDDSLVDRINEFENLSDKEIDEELNEVLGIEEKEDEEHFSIEEYFGITTKKSENDNDNEDDSHEELAIDSEEDDTTSVAEQLKEQDSYQKQVNSFSELIENITQTTSPLSNEPESTDNINDNDDNNVENELTTSDINLNDISIDDLSIDDISLEDLEALEQTSQTDESSMLPVQEETSDTEAPVEDLLLKAFDNPEIDEKMKNDLLSEILLEEENLSDAIEIADLKDTSDNTETDATSDFFKVIDSLSKTISELEKTPDLLGKSQEEKTLTTEEVAPVPENTSDKAINILINKDDIFSIAILNETYEIVTDFDGISVISENIHISTPKNNFYVTIGDKYIEIHKQTDSFIVNTNFEDIEFANAINNVTFAKKKNKIELNIKASFKISSINKKIELSMLNTSIANLTNSQKDSEDNSSICDNKTLVINEETQKVYLPYTIEEVMQKLNNSSSYQSLEDVIEQEYILPLSTFKMPIISRFKEAYRFMRTKEKSSVYAALDLAIELMFNSNLNPAVIRASKDLKELNIYLDCLYENELEKFDCFKVIYKVLPKIQ